MEINHMKLRDIARYTLVLGLLSSGIATAGINIYSLSEAKTVGVASGDEKRCCSRLWTEAASSKASASYWQSK